MMNMNRIEITLRHQAYRALHYEWGSQEQVRSENYFFDLARKFYGFDPEDHPYLLKATTEEMVDYTLKQCGLNP